MYTEFLSKLPDAATYEKLSEEKISEMEKEFYSLFNVEIPKDYIELFLSAKRVEGRSEKSLLYYSKTIHKVIDDIGKDARCITTDDLRMYLSEYQTSHNSSKVTIDNIRRILSSFFGWLEDEDYIVKSPVRRIHKVKSGSVVK